MRIYNQELQQFIRIKDKLNKSHELHEWTLILFVHWWQNFYKKNCKILFALIKKLIRFANETKNLTNMLPIVSIQKKSSLENLKRTNACFVSKKSAEQRTANSEQRTANSEQRTANSIKLFKTAKLQKFSYIVLMLFIGIFSSYKMEAHHIYGTRIDYQLVSTRTRNGQPQIQYRIRVIINTDGSNLNNPQNKNLVLRCTDLSNG